MDAGRRKRLAALIGVGLLLAGALALALVFSLGQGPGERAQAADTTGLNFSLSTAGCDSSIGPGLKAPASTATPPVSTTTPTATQPPPKANCAVPANSQFTVAFNVIALGAAPAYDGYDTVIVWSGNVNYINGSIKQQGAGTWENGGANGCGVPASTQSGGTPTPVGPTATGTPGTPAKNVIPGNPVGSMAAGCIQGLGATASTYTGALMTMGFDCKGSGSGTIALLLGDSTDIVDASLNSYNEVGASESLTVTCLSATNTPTMTPTFTPAPTFTPNPNPQMALDVKGIGCDFADHSHRPLTCTANYFLGNEKNGQFTLQVKTGSVIPAGGYGGFQTEVDLTSGLTYNSAACTTEVVWIPTPGNASSVTCTHSTNDTRVRDKGTFGSSPPFSNTSSGGKLVNLNVHCNAAGPFTVRLTQSDAPTTESAYIGTDGNAIALSPPGTADQLTINCVGPAPEMSLSASGTGVVCNTPIPPSTKPEKCSAPFIPGTTPTPFQIKVNANVLPVNATPSLNGYGGFDSEVVFGGLRYPLPPAPCLSEAAWPGAYLCSQGPAPTPSANYKLHQVRSAIFPPFPASNNLATPLLSIGVACPSLGQFQVVLPAFNTGQGLGAQYLLPNGTPARWTPMPSGTPGTPAPLATVAVGQLDLDGNTQPDTTFSPVPSLADVLLINCVQPPPTSTPTVTNTPTVTLTPPFTLTPTFTVTPSRTPTLPATSTPTATNTPRPTSTPTVTPTPTPVILTGPGKVTTDPEGLGATADHQIQTSVFLPSSTGGEVTINERVITQPIPTGYTLFGRQVDIPAAPPGTAARPLIVTFWLDVSIIPPGASENDVQVFKDGVLVPDCTGAPNTASANPCVMKRNLLTGSQAGDVQLVVLSTTASSWNFGTASGGATPTPMPTSSHPLILGDINCDGDVNAIDAEVLLQYVAGLTSLPCPPNADANKDGQIDATDALLILQFVSGLIHSLPPSGGAGAALTPWSGFAGLSAWARGL